MIHVPTMSEKTKISKCETGGKFKRLQLYNPLHKSEVLKLFCGVQRFQWATEDSQNPKQNENNLEFEASDDDEPVQIQTIAQSSTCAGNIICNTCGASFLNSKELRQHYKLDWHRYNVKRKLHEQTAVTEEYFNEMIDDLSSIEGSGSEDEDSIKTDSVAITKLMERISHISGAEKESSKPSVEESNRRKIINSPKAYFENEEGRVFAIYKPIAETLSSDDSGKNTLHNFHKCVENPLTTAVIMVSGGHFAAAVFKGNDVVLHKTFHSYTVRAKQGGSQGSKDSKSGTSHPKSAGASLRRYNEASFTQHVQELMESWKTRLATCQLIFLRAVSSSANVLFTGKNPPFQRDSEKLRTIPFPTKRPTFSEVKRVHSFLTVLHVYENRLEFLSEHLIKSTPKIKTSPKKKLDRAKSKSPKRREVPCPERASSSDDDHEPTNEIVMEEEQVDFNHLKEYDDSLTIEQRQQRKQPKKSKPKKPKVAQFQKPVGTIGYILDAVTSNSLEIQHHFLTMKNESADLPQEEFLALVNQPVEADESTLLHVAAKNNALNAIWPLMEFGCDPAVKNKEGKYAYNYATTKESRAEFRRFMAQFPDKYDYKKGHVPAPLTEEMEAEKAEKQKLLNKLKREKEKQKKMEKKAKEKELDEQDRFLKLSDREKRAMAAEQRILAQCKQNSEKRPVLARCFDCACDMTGKVPFEYNKNIFCTTKCLATHRKKFPTPLSVS